MKVSGVGDYTLYGGRLASCVNSLDNIVFPSAIHMPSSAAHFYPQIGAADYIEGMLGWQVLDGHNNLFPKGF